MLNNVVKVFSRLAHMILFGLSSFSLNKVRYSRRRVLQRKFLTASERWAILGDRLRKATNKMVK
ncbi:MAG: hypothetical protein IKP64_09710 [Selenomonadaceae bacterium]|nr:hypothetical protein [Selenomonadaceae bacterium]